MSGHSKWATIKHKKAATDAKRGKMFSKLAKEMTVAAKQGGGNPNANPRLRMVMDKARSINMPSDNIDRAIKKGTGELPGVIYEEIIYEGYGPAGVAVLVEALTDNKNRTTAEIRTIFTKKGGNMAGAGSVQWIFKKKGFIIVKKQDVDEDKVMSAALDAGAEDLETQSDVYEITTSSVDMEKVKTALEKAGIAIESAEITMIPSSEIKVSGAPAKTLLSLIEALEDHEDVQNVYANFDMPDDMMEAG
ncbi:MAG: YebC/PmpR family DNA-binding transcriptional regulator [Candidatus Omnitrophica bacterium]|nr:YebC/PmpR family DNA-binding transcriptional regulator [Candidatus Omnitrophota bacterium]